MAEATSTLKLSHELIQTLEAFQQACVIATGPYNDGHDRLCKFAYGSSDTELTREDFEWIQNFVTEMSENFDTAAQEMANALEDFDDEMDRIENACVHGEDPEYCDECYALENPDEDEVEA